MTEETPPKVITKEEKLVMDGTGCDHFEAYLALTCPGNRAVEQVINKMNRDKYRNRLLEHLDECIIRFGGLHSWYKYRNSSWAVYMVPVVGNVQETDRFDYQVSANDVYWHIFPTHERIFDFAFIEEKAIDPIRSLVKNNPVNITSEDSAYLSGSNQLQQLMQRYIRHDTGTPTLIRKQHFVQNIRVAALSFAKDFMPFHSFYAKCVTTANKMIDEIVQHPEYRLPQGLADQVHFITEEEEF